MRPIRKDEFDRVFGGFGTPPTVGVPSTSGIGYLYPSPTGIADATLAGSNLARDLGEFIDTEDPWLLGNVFESGFDFINSLSDLMNTPSQSTFDSWNAWGAESGIAPGEVYIGYDSLGNATFDIDLNSISGDSGYQISWHVADSPSDTSGPVIEFE
jgi:hypothetical protein